ncbi:hypothetical protein BH10PSE1_BH10PSE1_06210 [soil metagenome]
MTNEPENYTAEVAAIFLCLETILSILDRIEPDEVDRSLRAARLQVQEETHGRLRSDEAALSEARRLYQSILERAVARNREAD